jgi:hypothetical protein
MNLNLVPLHDGRPGLRTLLQVEAHESTSEMSDTSCNSCLDFISSTSTLDRYHEIIDPAGWHLDSYRRNPVFQNAHNYGDILFTLGKALITELRGSPRPSDGSGAGGEGGGTVLFQRIQFATEANPIARIAYSLYRGKFLNAVSVGFIPLRWEDAPPGSAGVSPASAKPPRRRYLEQELLEVSAVAIPANPDALALAIKSGAVEKSDLRESLALVLEVERTTTNRPDRPNVRASNYPTELFQLARELRRILRSA